MMRCHGGVGEVEARSKKQEEGRCKESKVRR